MARKPCDMEKQFHLDVNDMSASEMIFYRSVSLLACLMDGHSE